MLKHVYLWFFLLFLQLLSFSQQMYFENISEKMSLPSQECYNILQDKKGYIWFSTEQGLCRYNGEVLLKYDEKNGLPEKAVYAMREDSKGRLWIITSANRILYIESEKIKEATFSETFRKATFGETVSTFTFTDDYNMCVSMLVKGTFLIDTRTGMCVELQQTQKQYDYNVNLLHNKLVAFNGTTQDYSPEAGYLSRLNYFENGTLKKIIPVPQTKTEVRSAFLLTCTGKKAHYIAFKQNLVVLNADGTYEIHQFPSTILSVYLDRQGDLWVGTLLKGVFYYNHADLKTKPLNNLNHCSVSRVIQDNENNIWCTTLEKGLFFCKNKEILSYNMGNMQQNPEMLICLDNTIYVGWQKKIFALSDGDTVRRLPINFIETDYITDMVYFDHKYYICSYSFMLQADKDFKNICPVRQKHWPYNGAAKQLKVSKGRLYTMSSASVGEIKGTMWEYHNAKTLVPLGRCFEPISDGKFLVGAKDGMWMITWAGDSSIATRVPGITQPVSSMMKDNKGRVLATTKGEGLFLYTGEKMIPLNDSFNISSRILFEIIQDVAGRYWISSNEGLFCSDVKDNRTRTVLYTALDGLPANEIHKLAATRDRIFFSSIYGVSSLPLKKEEKTTSDPKIYLSALQINRADVNLKALPHELSYNHKNFKFYFDLISFKNNGHHMVYKLKGRDEIFLHLNTSQLTIENLSPGEYELIVYAENEMGARSKQPFVYRFNIAKPFWLTWWFVIAMLGLLIFIFIIILYTLARRIQARADEKNRINVLLAESQLTAIQAQMNPHFVFNAINSIQNYILKSQKEEAYNYLAKFSHLIRMVLNNSQKKMQPLNKELEMLCLYVELEQLRFKQSFEFEIQVDPSIDEREILLPPMLIQPLVENAIWHGLMPLEKRKGKLQLLFSIEKKLFKIRVEDNGIGREQSLKNKINMNHHSIALDLVKERIKMIKKLYQEMEYAYMSILDLFDESGQPVGTRVDIYLPIL